MGSWPASYRFFFVLSRKCPLSGNWISFRHAMTQIQVDNVQVLALPLHSSIPKYKLCLEYESLHWIKLDRSLSVHFPDLDSSHKYVVFVLFSITPSFPILTLLERLQREIELERTATWLSSKFPSLSSLCKTKYQAPDRFDVGAFPPPSLDTRYPFIQYPHKQNAFCRLLSSYTTSLCSDFSWFPALIATSLQQHVNDA